MGVFRAQIVLALCLSGVLTTVDAAFAQDTSHEHMQMSMPTDGGWRFMQDGIVFAEFNHQGGPRGGSEFVVPNWWMGMASRDTRRGRLTLIGMLSLDPLTVGTDGYRELFQAGEALNGRPLIDRQHPLEPGNIVRSTASASWTRTQGAAIASVTAAFGVNNTGHGTRGAFFVEGSRHAGMNTLYGRFEAVQAETALLANGELPVAPAP